MYFETYGRTKHPWYIIVRCSIPMSLWWAPGGPNRDPLSNEVGLPLASLVIALGEP